MQTPSAQAWLPDKAVEQCSFCEELINPRRVTLPAVREFFDKFDESSRVLLETHRFFIVPSLGALMEGHILILPKSHYYSVGEIPEADVFELEQLLHQSKMILCRAYRACTVFEHGCVEGVGKGGACVDHAHLHLLPLDKDLRPLINKRFGTGVEIRGLVDLKKFFSREVPYLYYQGPDTAARAYDAPIAPSQFFRQLVFSAIEGVGNWDWKSDLRASTVKQTYARLKMDFDKIQKPT